MQNNWMRYSLQMQRTRTRRARILQMLEEEPVDLFDYSNLPFSPRSFAAQNMEFLSALKKLGQPRFQFDWKHKEFTGTSGCDYLRYVKNDTFIRVQDMFALANAADCKFNVPELAEDYKELWEIYTSGCDRFEKSVNRWNQLCADLARYDDENTKKVTIPKYEVQVQKRRSGFASCQTTHSRAYRSSCGRWSVLGWRLQIRM